MTDVVTGVVEKVMSDVPEAVNDVVTLSSGAVVRVKKLPQTVVMTAWRQFPEPRPPTVEINQGGKKWREDNPSDPNYLSARREWTMQMSEVILNLTILRGMEILSLPDSILPYEQDDTWEDECQSIGLPVPQGHTAARKLLWMKYRIMPSDEDVDMVQEISRQLSGVSEEEVAAAVQSFPSKS